MARLIAFRVFFLKVVTAEPMSGRTADYISILLLLSRLFSALLKFLDRFLRPSKKLCCELCFKIYFEKTAAAMDPLLFILFVSIPDWIIAGECIACC
jgi:hypothetical protein